MEVFVQQLPPRATDLDVTEALAPFIRDATLTCTSPHSNFNVRVCSMQNERGGGSYCNAKLTFADVNVGQRFLRTHATQTPIRVFGKPPRFFASNKPVDETLVKKLRASTFVDPAKERERQRELAELEEPIAVAGLDFGRLCSDDVYSAEIKRTVVDGAVIFDVQERNLVVGFTGRGCRVDVAMAFGSISRALVLPGTSPSVLLLLNRPPQIFSSPAGGLSGGFSSLSLHDTPPKMRRSYLSTPDQARTPFVTTTVRLIFPFNSDREKFILRRGKAHLPTVAKSTITVERRQPYSEGHLAIVRAMLSRLNIRVAFQIQLMLQNGLLDAFQLS